MHASTECSWAGLQRCVPKALNAVDLLQIRRYARRCQRFMDAYRKGLTGKAMRETLADENALY